MSWESWVLTSFPVSKKYAELYEHPRRTAHYTELPDHEVTLASAPSEPTAFVATPAVSEVRLLSHNRTLLSPVAR